MNLDLPRSPTPFPQRGPRSSHATSPSLRKREQRLNTVRICRKYPFDYIPKADIQSLHMLNHYLRCSRLPPALLWVWTISRSRLGPNSVLQILHKYFRNTKWFILRLHLFINQKRLSDRKPYYIRVLKNTDQIFVLWKFYRKQKAQKKSYFPDTSIS